MANVKKEYRLVAYTYFDLFLKEVLESTSHTLKNACRRSLSILTRDQVSIWKSGQNKDKLTTTRISHYYQLQLQIHIYIVHCGYFQNQ